MIAAPPLKLALIPALAMLGACAGQEAEPPPPDPQDEFWSALTSHCGKAYAGQLVSDDTADADFAGAPMVMHVSECSDDRIAIPFHVEIDGEWDRSRTWLITRNEAGGLRLKHDHRHEDGEPDAVTMYGGDTIEDGTLSTQAFPVDEESIALFEREGLCASVINVWTVEVDAKGRQDATFSYQLMRPKGSPVPGMTLVDECPEFFWGRHFRVEFDLANQVDAPPPAWGWE